MLLRYLRIPLIHFRPLHLPSCCCSGEIGFFDFYVIPLAKKLDSCGVFGVSSHEYLGYAQANRDEWERRGEDIVKEYIENWKEIKQAPQEEQAVEDSTPVESFEQEPIDGDLDNV